MMPQQSEERKGKILIFKEEELRLITMTENMLETSGEIIFPLYSGVCVCVCVWVCGCVCVCI